MIAVIDGDVLCYQSSVVGSENNETPLQWNPRVETVQGGGGLTIQIVRQKIDQWCGIARCDPDEAIIVFSDPDGVNFRKGVCPHYKLQRTTEKPADYGMARDFITERYKTYSIPKLEGDDLIGLLLTGPNGKHYVGISTDKDIYTIPGNVVRVGDQKSGYLRNTIREADKYWMTQTITGDMVDNYKGCPGAGKKRAEEALRGLLSLPTMWEKVLYIYADMFDHPKWGEKFTQPTAYDEALMNARCARILRYGDWDKETGDIKLWTP